MTMSPHYLRLVALGMMAVFAQVSPCIAQDEDPEPLPEPSVFINAVREAYRAGPIGEHVTVRVRDATGRSTTGRFRVFLNVDSAGDGDVLRIEFDPLQVSWAGSGGSSLTAISKRNETIFFTEPLPGKPDLATISSALRPVPLPQLELAFSDDESFSNPTPYTPGTVWTSAVLGTRGIGGSEVVVIEGFSAGRLISFTIDPITDRLHSLHAEIGSPDEPDSVVLDLEFRPLKVPPVADWKIETARRTQVDQITDLFPRKGLVREGELSPEIALFNKETTPWRLGNMLSAMAGGENPPHALALILFRHDVDPQTQEEFMAAAWRGAAALDVVHAIAISPQTDPQLIEPGVTGPWRVSMQAGVVFRLGDYAPARYTQLVDRWVDRWTEESSSLRSLLWSPSPGRSIDWFDAEAGAVLVLVGLDNSLLLIEALDADTDTDELATKVVAALHEAHPPYSLLVLDEDREADIPSTGLGPPPPH